MRASDGPKGGDSRVPRLAADADPTRLTLSPEEGYLLSRIDGRTPWHVLCAIGGMPPEQVEKRLERWLREGLLTLSEGASIEPSASPAAASASGGRTLPGVDASLELPVEVQRRVLEFHARLGEPYHRLLGVAADADARALKRAYFALSKQFHPDRYFRRRIGPFAPLIEEIFKKLVEAYELLSDPTARAEVARSLEAEPRPAAAAGDGSRSRPQAAPRRLGRSRHVFSMHARLRAQRKRKAKSFFESGMAAFAAERWLEAAGAVRLAIAFDPWNDAYRDRFADVQRKAHEERAAQLIREGESALELRDAKEALRLFEEALHFRPVDAELAHRTARLAWLGASDLRRAKEYAAQACELDPDCGAYHRTLGQIYKEAGLTANARRELETALLHDPEDAEARVELRALGSRLRLPLSFGGRR